MYERITPFFDAETQPYAMIAFRDSVLRIEGFMSMIVEWEYRTYQKSPYVWVDIGGVYTPNVLPEGKLEIYQVWSPQTEVTPTDPIIEDTTVSIETPAIPTSLEWETLIQE